LLRLRGLRDGRGVPFYPRSGLDAGIHRRDDADCSSRISSRFTVAAHLAPRGLHHPGCVPIATEFLRLIPASSAESPDFDAESLMLCRAFRTVTVLFAPPAAVII